VTTDRSRRDVLPFTSSDPILYPLRYSGDL